MHSSSLEIFEQISLHLTINKGVRVVRAILHYYDEELANDPSFDPSIRTTERSQPVPASVPGPRETSVRRDIYSSRCGRVSRFTIAKTLELRDSDLGGRIRCWKLLERANDNDILRHSLLHRIPWEELRNHQLGPPPAEVLVKPPGAIHKAGGLITALEIDLSALCHYPLLS